MAIYLNLNIIQWNIRSANTNRHNMNIIIRDMSPDIIALNETWLKSSFNYHFKNYDTIRKDRSDGRGGVAFLIKNTLNFKTVDLDLSLFPPNFQGIGIEIQDLQIINVYAPPDVKLDSYALIKLFNFTDGSRIVLGDLNGNNTAWGSGITNHNGKTILNSLDYTDLIVLNDGSATRFTPPDQNTSAVDISLASPEITCNTTWRVLNDCGNSDHFPIQITINNINKVVFSNSHNEGRRCFRKADWDSYSREITDQSKNINVMDLDGFMRVLEVAAEKAIPKYHNRNETRKTVIPWWDDECAFVVRKRKLAIKSYKEQPSLKTYLYAKQSIALSRKLIKRKKRESFRKFCSNINRNSDPSVIWNYIRRIKVGLNPIDYRKLPNRKVANNILDKLSSCLIDPEFTWQRDDSNSIELINKDELSAALIKKKRDTATGLDNVSYSMLSNLPSEGREMLLSLYNSHISQNSIPVVWKSILIHPILKPNKDLNDAESYRPIALESCIAKVLESILKSRLEWFIENGKLLPESQSGFRRGKSCLNSVAHLTSLVHLGFSRNRFILALFIDIKGAYDSVNIFLLYKYMTDLKVPAYLRNIIFQILNDRQIFIRDCDGNIIGPRTGNMGLPQGSPLSPILFNIYTHNLKYAISDKIEILQYADDIVLLADGAHIPTLVDQMNNSLMSLAEWCEIHNFRISINKTNAVLFRKGTSKTIIPEIVLNNEVIPRKDKVKYLGIIIHQNLNWKHHIDDVIGKAQKGMNVLRAICGTTWGADPVSLLMMYRGMIRSHLDFGCQLISPSSKDNLYKLDKIQYQAIRILTGCMKSTPINVLLAETSEMPLELRRKWLSCKFILRNIIVKDNPLIKDIISLKDICASRLGYWARRNNPYLTEEMNEFEQEMNLVETYNIAPCFQVGYFHQIKRIKTFFSSVF